MSHAPVVLITGGSAGIGRATARTFAQAGYRLAIAARDLDPLTQTALALEQDFNADVLALAADTTVLEQTQQLVAQTLTRYGQIDVLVNNAGICMMGSFSATTLDHWQQILSVNLWGYIHMIQAVLPHFQERGQGKIVNVGSFGGKMPLPMMTAYCTSKYAVTGLTESLRLELKPQGIAVIGIHPGVVRSDFLKRTVFVEDDTRRASLESAMQGWLATDCETVATAILEAVLNDKTDVVVGWAQLMTGAYQVFPDWVGPWLGQGTP